MLKPLVSVIIPTKNNSAFLKNCLKSIKSQTHKNIEVIIVDSYSVDDTVKIAQKSGCRIYFYKSKHNGFDAPEKRNFGVSKAKGEFVYYLDADMEMPTGLIKEALGLCLKENFDALIIPEDSFGNGIWAHAKQLERRCYWGDKNVEAARFFRKKVWENLGGLDVSLGGGGDDWDLQQRLIENNYDVGRCISVIKHNEGNLSLTKLIKKRFMYGKDSIKYLKKNPKKSFINYFPIRSGYIKNLFYLLKHPVTLSALAFMRICEYSAGFIGIIYAIVKNEK